MLWFRQRVLRLRTSADGRAERGATAVEYGLIVALFVIGMFGVVTMLRTSLNNSYTSSEARVGSPQSQLAAPSLSIDYAVVGTCAASGQFYDSLSGTCDATKAACGANQWPDPQTQTCVASQKSMCQSNSSGYDIQHNTCVACVGATPVFQSSDVSCRAAPDCTGSNQVLNATYSCVTPAAPTVPNKSQAKGTSNVSYDVLTGWTYDSPPYSAVVTAASVTTKSWGTGAPSVTAPTFGGNNVTVSVPSPSGSGNYIIITFTATVTYTLNGVPATATVTGTMRVNIT